MGKTTKVLFVDDEDEILDLYQMMCQDKYEVETYSSGSLAVESFDESFDIAFFDRRMPDISGYEAIKQIQSEGYDTPMVIVSGTDEDESTFQVEYCDYLNKPIGRDEIHNTIENYAKQE